MPVLPSMIAVPNDSRAAGVLAQREARARIFLEGVYLTISLRAVSKVYRSNGSQPISNVAVGRGVFHLTPPFWKKLYLSPFPISRSNEQWAKRDSNLYGIARETRNSLVKTAQNPAHQ